MLDKIIIKGAREHNLKNISLEIPRNKLIVLTGLSGSGKSTLAFDTIYAEGQRRYVDSLSSYARQFIGVLNKPDIDSIEGLSPAISIEQKTTSKNPRSTVGTITEIYDYLRLLFARIGKIYCPKCNELLKPQTQEIILRQIMEGENKKIIILAPIVRGMKGFHDKIFDDLQKEGFIRVRIDGKIYRIDELDEKIKLERYEKHWIEAVIDNIEVNEENRQRISDGIEQALKKGNGTIIILDPKEEKKDAKEISRGTGEKIYSTFGACPNHPEIIFEELEPRMFSFNSPFGACPNCLGLGEKVQISPDLVIPDKNKSIMAGALAVYGKMDLKWRGQQLAAVGKKYGFDLFTPIKDFTKEQMDALLYGTNEPLVAKWKDGSNMRMENGWEGVINQTMRLYSQTESDYMKEKYEKFMISIPCNVCNGKRLKEKILAVRICEKSIIDLSDLSIEKAIQFFNSLDLSLSEKEKIISKQITKEIKERLGFLQNVGLGYLTISRSAKTLSGGEAQRIRLATQIGSNLMGVLYILDEPSIGLHQKDNKKLINTLHRLRDIGNTLIVVEHDEDTIREANYIIDIGPGAGELGGYICAEGKLEDIINNEKSITGKYLKGELKIETPKKRRIPKGFIELLGANENNLKNIDVSFPTGILCAITGVSGSGKSTLMNETLVNALKKKFGYSISKEGKYAKIDIPKECNDVIVIDQEPIGRTPRSNPATYTKLFDDIREIFSNTLEGKKRGYNSGRFSFNTIGGRCEECKGDGVIKIEMNFLSDVYVECEECKGKRYNKETLEITYKGKTIADILNMTVSDALVLFENHSSIKRKLQTLNDVGLGYIKLGQSATTLSGGESQRIKLTRELSKFKKPGTVYILDEPTTGLHFEDVRKLLVVLNRLVDKGNSIYVIEHNLDVIKSCDYVIDLGPEGGEKGGLIIAQGTPEDIANAKESYTGEFLRKILK